MPISKDRNLFSKTEKNDVSILVKLCEIFSLISLLLKVLTQYINSIYSIEILKVSSFRLFVLELKHYYNDHFDYLYRCIDTFVCIFEYKKFFV